MGRRPSVFVRSVTTDEGWKLQRISRTAKERETPPGDRGADIRPRPVGQGHHHADAGRRGLTSSAARPPQGSACPLARREAVCGVLDNFSPHKHADVRASAVDNDIELVFPPTHGSWLNRIEAEFAALRYFALNGTDHRSHEEQNAAVAAYIRWHNARAEPWLIVPICPLPIRGHPEAPAFDQVPLEVSGTLMPPEPPGKSAAWNEGPQVIVGLVAAWPSAHQSKAFLVDRAVQSRDVGKGQSALSLELRVGGAERAGDAGQDGFGAGWFSASPITAMPTRGSPRWRRPAG